jgi:hypothetical protein
VARSLIEADACLDDMGSRASGITIAALGPRAHHVGTPNGGESAYLYRGLPSGRSSRRTAQTIDRSLTERSSREIGSKTLLDRSSVTARQRPAARVAFSRRQE